MTIVATHGPTHVTCDPVAVPPKRHRNFRIEDEEWAAFSRVSELLEERTSERMRQLVKTDNAKHKKLLDADPVWQKRQADRAVDRAAKAADG